MGAGLRTRIGLTGSLACGLTFELLPFVEQIALSSFKTVRQPKSYGAEKLKPLKAQKAHKEDLQS
jgi:hypothetical protein